MSRVHVYTLNDDDEEVGSIVYHPTLEDAVERALVVLGDDPMDDLPVEVIRHRVVSLRGKTTAERTAFLLGGMCWCDEFAVVWRDGKLLDVPEIQP